MNKEKIIDDSSRDYALSDITMDPRIIQTTKEFWITMISYILFAALMIANLLLVSRINATFLGFPLWIFLEIVLIIGFVAMVFVLATYVYKDMDITPTGKIHHTQEGVVK